MDICICERQTEDWANLDVATFWASYTRKFSYLRDFGATATPPQQLETFRRHLENWNARYSPNYFEYRARVKAIARRNWEATGLPVVPIGEADFSRDVIWLPSDDDDWFAPNIGQVLRQLFTEDRYLRSVKWAGLTLTQGQVYSYDGDVSSNGYAFRGFDLYDLARYHCLCSHQVQRTVSDCLSVWVRHLGAWCQLCHSFDTSLPAAVLPEALSWMRPYAAELTALNLRLKALKEEE